MSEERGGVHNCSLKAMLDVASRVASILFKIFNFLCYDGDILSGLKLS